MQVKTIGKWAQKLALLLLSFLDDIALFTLSRIGLHWVWLRWVSSIVLIATLSYWAFRMLRYCYRQQIP